MEDLLAAWHRALAPGSKGWRESPGSPGALDSPDVAADAVGRELLTRWAQPHRAYHDLDHLRAVLATVDAHPGVAADPDVVRLGAFFHDAVYDPRRHDNEAASAALAERVLPPLGVPPRRVAAVARLVRLTAEHDPGPDDRDGRLLCDADLAVLAGAADSYARYAAAVRVEYSHLPDDAFRAGRAQVLRRLLGRPALYGVPALHAAWEQRARANLAAELARPAPGAS